MPHGKHVVEWIGIEESHLSATLIYLSLWMSCACVKMYWKIKYLRAYILALFA